MLRPDPAAQMVSTAGGYGGARRRRFGLLDRREAVRATLDTLGRRTPVAGLARAVLTEASASEKRDELTQAEGWRRLDGDSPRQRRAADPASRFAPMVARSRARRRTGDRKITHGLPSFSLASAMASREPDERNRGAGGQVTR